MERTPGFGLRGILVLSFRLVLGAMFLYAGIVKIADPAAFAQAVANYRILPLALVNAAAVILNEKRHQKMITNAPRTKGLYTWAEIGRQWIKMLKRL